MAPHCPTKGTCFCRRDHTGFGDRTPSLGDLSGIAHPAPPGDPILRILRYTSMVSSRTTDLNTSR